MRRRHEGRTEGKEGTEGQAPKPTYTRARRDETAGTQWGERTLDCQMAAQAAPAEPVPPWFQAPETPSPPEAPMAVTEKSVMDALKTVKDPELNLNLVVLGLVYDVDIQGTHVHTRMSLTSPMCPVAEQIVHMAEEAVLGVDGVETAKVQLTFDPPWTPERISPLIRSSLGL